MRFLILSKKETFNNNLINEKILDSVNAPSLKSTHCIKKELSNLEIFLYTYDMCYDEKKDFSYNFQMII